MNIQIQELSADAGRSGRDRRVRAAWIFACAFPAILLLFLFALTLYATPEHDDFCFAYTNAAEGFVRTALSFYQGVTGRLVPLFLAQIPAVLSRAMGSSLLAGYSVTMSVAALIFLAGTALAMARAWPHVRGLPLLFLCLAFAAAILGSSRSVRDLLYWLPAVVCYVPSGLVSILILGECVRALDQESEFSGLATFGMALGGFLAALCNEFTGVWLVGFIASSMLARRVFGQNMQIRSHVLIAAVVLIGWLIVVLAGGNTYRMAAFSGAARLGHSLIEALRYSMVGLGQVLREPAIIGWLIAVGAVTLAAPEPARPANPRSSLLALGVILITLACCYFEYFAHHYSTGVRIVERAQNEALILLLFGATLTVSLLVRAHRAKLRETLLRGRAPLPLDSTALPLLLGGLMAASLGLSKTGFLIYAEHAGLSPFRQESLARDRLLATSREPVVIVPKHRWTPSLLMSADANVNTGCLAGWYGKSDLIVVEPGPP